MSPGPGGRVLPAPDDKIQAGALADTDTPPPGHQAVCPALPVSLHAATEGTFVPLGRPHFHLSAGHPSHGTRGMVSGKAPWHAGKNISVFLV